MADTLESLMAAARERLTKEREEIFNQQTELEEKLKAIDLQLEAIRAHDDVLAGKGAKHAPAPPAATKRRGPAPGTKKGDGPSGKRAEVLDLIRRTPDGTTSAQISEHLNATDKAGKQSVANALSALKSEQLIAQAQKRGAYTVAP